jgi:hypothetical protein
MRESVVWDGVFLNDTYLHLRPFLGKLGEICLAFTCRAQWQHAKVEFDRRVLCQLAAETGSITLVEWAMHVGWYTMETMNVAIAGGHLALLAWLWEQGHRECSMGEPVRVLPFLQERRLTKVDTEFISCLCCALLNERKDLVLWIVAKGGANHVMAAFHWYSRETSNEMLCWLFESGLWKATFVPHIVLMRDDPSIVERLFVVGCLWDTSHTRYIQDFERPRLREWYNQRVIT